MIGVLMLAALSPLTNAQMPTNNSDPMAPSHPHNESGAPTPTVYANGGSALLPPDLGVRGSDAPSHLQGPNAPDSSPSAHRQSSSDAAVARHGHSSSNPPPTAHKHDGSDATLAPHEHSNADAASAAHSPDESDEAAAPHKHSGSDAPSVEQEQSGPVAASRTHGRSKANSSSPVRGHSSPEAPSHPRAHSESHASSPTDGDSSSYAPSPVLSPELGHRGSYASSPVHGYNRFDSRPPAHGHSSPDDSSPVHGQSDADEAAPGHARKPYGSATAPATATAKQPTNSSNTPSASHARKLYNVVLLEHEYDLAIVRLNEVLPVVDGVIFVQPAHDIYNRAGEAVLPAGPPFPEALLKHPKVALERIEPPAADWNCTQRWELCMEAYARDWQGGFLLQHPGVKEDDIAVLSDADEIPRAEALQHLRKYMRPGTMSIMHLTAIHHFKFSLRCEQREVWKEGPIAVSVRLLAAVGSQRARRDQRLTNRLLLPNASWHFSGMSARVEGNALALRDECFESLDVPGAGQIPQVLEEAEASRREALCLDSLGQMGKSLVRTAWNASVLPGYPDVTPYLEGVFREGAFPHFLNFTAIPFLPDAASALAKASFTRQQPLSPSESPGWMHTLRTEQLNLPAVAFDGGSASVSAFRLLSLVPLAGVAAGALIVAIRALRRRREPYIPVYPNDTSERPGVDDSNAF